MNPVPSLPEFLELSDEEVFELVYPHRLSISILLNGTRRWYISRHFDEPPTDSNFLMEYLETVFLYQSMLLDLLASHGIFRIFIPVYSEEQHGREANAHVILVAGINALASHPALLEAYARNKISVRYYGHTTLFTDKFGAQLPTPPRTVLPRHQLYYGIDIADPFGYVSELMHNFSLQMGRKATRAEIVERYYGEDVGSLNILIAYNRTYTRVGMPPLLEGKERIYTTVVTPLALTRVSLREILYDYLFVQQDAGRSYTNLSSAELKYLKSFYADNINTVLGLTYCYDKLVFPRLKFSDDGVDRGR